MDQGDDGHPGRARRRPDHSGRAQRASAASSSRAASSRARPSTASCGRGGHRRGGAWPPPASCRSGRAPVGPVGPAPGRRPAAGPTRATSFMSGVSRQRAARALHRLGQQERVERRPLAERQDDPPRPALQRPDAQRPQPHLELHHLAERVHLVGRDRRSGRRSRRGSPPAPRRWRPGRSACRSRAAGGRPACRGRGCRPAAAAPRPGRSPRAAASPLSSRTASSSSWV